MGVYALGDLTGSVDPTAYVHPTAELIGDVVIHPHRSVVMEGARTYRDLATRYRDELVRLD